MGKTGNRRRKLSKVEELDQKIDSDRTAPLIPKKVRNITIFEDPALTYPDLYLAVHVVGNEYDQRSFAEFFCRTKSYRAKSLDEADLVVFSGGPDVDPALYGAKPHPSTSFDPERDEADIVAFLQCVEQGIPMLGVCRGAQFGHVMHEGRLFQHVDQHNRAHSIFCRATKKIIERTSSVHHQMVVPNISGGMEIIATGGASTERWVNDKIFDTGPHSDIEAFFYEETMFLGIQGHPEYTGYPRYSQWCADTIQDFIVLSTHTTYVDNRLLRLKPELLEEQKAKWLGNLESSPESEGEA